MTKKSLLTLVLAVIVAGGVFAQTNFASMPKNTFTVDVGPTIVGLAIGQAGKIAENIAGNMVENFPEINSAGFGIAAQYERQVFNQLGIAARVAYLGFGFTYRENITDSQSGATGNASLELDIKTISAEGHARFYPFAGRTFFLGGMLGYGNLLINASGEIVGRDPTTGDNIREPIVDFSAPRSYAKLGARLGWRIDFGRPGGFVFEPSFGYDHAIGLGDSFTKQLQKEVGGDVDLPSDMDDAFKILESYVLVGGPRVTLGFGWRF